MAEANKKMFYERCAFQYEIDILFAAT